MKSEKRGTSLWLWPFVALGNLIGVLVRLTGRLVAAVLGLVLMIAGVALSLTIVGAIAGVPLIIFGFMLMVRALF